MVIIIINSNCLLNAISGNYIIFYILNRKMARELKSRSVLHQRQTAQNMEEEFFKTVMSDEFAP